MRSVHTARVASRRSRNASAQIGMRSLTMDIASAQMYINSTGTFALTALQQSVLILIRNCASA